MLAELPAFELRILGAILITAIGTGSKRIKKQVLLHFKLGNDSFEENFLVCSQITGPVIVGANLFTE
jgi:hypothetical protein